MLTLSVKTSLTNYILPKFSYNLTDGSSVNGSSLSFVAQTGGFFDLPAIALYGMPGGSVELNFTFIFNQTARDPVRVEFARTLTLKTCAAGSVVNLGGYCKACVGPDWYLLEKPVANPTPASLFNINSCSACERGVFSCHGGDDIRANEGFQRVNPAGTATFLKCGKINGEHVCRPNNTCSEGYTGLLCNECERHFFRDFDGSCRTCPFTGSGDTKTFANGTFTVFAMLFYIVFALAALRIFMLLAISGQRQNKLSSGFHLLKNFITYTICFVLLSEIFGRKWMGTSLGQSPEFKRFISLMRWFYRVPLNAVDYQCYQDGGTASTAAAGAPKALEIYLSAANLTRDGKEGFWAADSSQWHRRSNSKYILVYFFSIILLLRLFSKVVRQAKEQPCRGARGGQ